MLARFVLGAVAAGAVIAPALAGQMMNADEARRQARCNLPAPVRCATCAFPVIRFRSAANPSAPRSGAFLSNRASTSTSKTSATSADRSRAWVSLIAISVVRAPRRCCWRGRWRDRVRCVRRCGPARWKSPRASKPRNSSDPGSSRSNPRRDRSFRNRKARQSCVAPPTDRHLRLPVLTHLEQRLAAIF